MPARLGPLLDQCLRDLSFFQLSSVCIKEFVIKGLSLGILAGSVAIKLPQIYKIAKNGSVAGIAESSLALELLSATSLCLYSYLSGFPFLAYGETFFIALQCLVLNLLFWVYGRVAYAPRLLALLFLYALVTTFAVHGLSPSALYFLASLPITLNLLARLPQIALNFRTRATGQLAFLTFFLSFAGNCARVATTLATISDSATLAGHLVAAALNGTIVAQILWFAGPSHKKNKQKSS
jgi:mannose-P-dolichol utilization defect protein 1